MEEILLTSWYGKYPIIYKDLYIPGGAGFLPSTVFWIYIYKYTKGTNGILRKEIYHQVKPLDKNVLWRNLSPQKNIRHLFLVTCV